MIPMDYSEVTENYLACEILPEMWPEPEFMRLLQAVRAGDRFAMGDALLDFINRTIKQERELHGLPLTADDAREQEQESLRNERQAFAPMPDSVQWFLRRD